MDSPNASGYVPLSLVDTLSKPTRSYRSIQSTPSLSSSRSIHHAHSSSLAALASKERSEQARREAAAISESLGLSSSFEKSVPETPIRRGGGGTSSFNHGDVEATPKPFQSYPSQASEIATLKAQLSERDQELAAFKREVGILRRDKKELVQKCEKLELDTAKGAARGGLDAVQVEELVKQFNDQEALLGGYQREAEKSLAELDRLRNKERRLNDWFERMYGPGWAEELSLTDKPTLSSSPAFRTNKFSSRPSLLKTHSSTSSITSNSSSSLPTDVFPSSSSQETSQPPSTSPSTIDTDPPPPRRPISNDDPTLSPLALRQHLDSVQALIRGMETRLIARGVELGTVEKRARQEARNAESKRIELDSLVLATSSSPLTS
ncbi:hypothetical protein JCM16303_000533 [Sporobolomyces ruberrimus]